MNTFAHNGFCPICEQNVIFSSEKEWFRDFLFCSKCGSIPRERALFKVLTDFFPNYSELSIHESSPSTRGASVKLQRECKGYTSSHFFPDVIPGKLHPISGQRCENLENLSFADESFEIFITQDVMEHIFDPEKAFREIARVLKPGGAYIFTVPIINKTKPSQKRATRSKDGSVFFHFEPEYHGNPIDAKGSLVTMHWGYDIALFIMKTARMPTIIIIIDNIDLGIRAEYIDVLVSFKQ